MSRQFRPMALPGSADPAVQPYEIEHARLSRRAAAEGFVLLKNESDTLPLPAGSRIALYGAGASRTIKGGTGSGDVNERYSISIFEGLKNAGYCVTTEAWIEDYDARYSRARQDWKERVLGKFSQAPSQDGMAFFNAYSTTPFVQPAGGKIARTDADTAVYVVSRIAGEGADRSAGAGDYCLSEDERAALADVCALYEKVVVLLNTGSVIDLGFMDDFPNITALLLVSQPGMEGGNAVADVLSGRIAPSGKLTDTWALRYGDYPGAAEFSHNNGDTLHAYYNEGIYVGYRYFDSFDVPVRYGFGYGLSYTEFSTEVFEVRADAAGAVAVRVSIANVGRCLGREVVQVYAMLPEGRLEKEVRRLVAFGKTRLLQPGERDTLELTFDAAALASYDEARAAWVLEAGAYPIFVGNSLAASRACGRLMLDADKLLVKTEHICPPQRAFEPLTLDAEARRRRCAALLSGAGEIPAVAYDLSGVETRVVDYAEPARESDEAARLVDGLTPEQLICMATGDPAKGQGNALGSAGVSVPGSAGETSACALEQGIASIVLADGPAGLRLNQTYYVQDGSVRMLPFESTLEHGLFYDAPQMEGTRMAQYCTAIPVGTLLAQTWDAALLESVGEMIGDEMRRFHVTLWLAPGMNIHRNPLCGRNFEYYSEDPLISGKMAAAITRGVQRIPGCGTTIKHFCCNNQEDDRMASDSILSERALREIYLRGFEIAIQESQPMAIMTSYNLVNGVHAANSRDLCTLAARREFGFEGLIMTDWTTTEHGEDCTAAGCMLAGNDLVMPGQFSDHASIRAALADGILPRETLAACIDRIVRIILRSDRYL